jgi:hypothetical protein
MSFGFSAGDFFLLIQLAKATYKICVEAGTEYNEIAREIRSLYAVLKPLRDEAAKPDSGLFRQDPSSAAELVKAIDGCTHILEDIQFLLAKYEGLSATGEAASVPKKLWRRFRFSSKIERLGVVRGKLIAYTSTISVLLDGVQLRATGRVEDKLDNVSSQMTEGFESLKKAILGMAVKARAEQRGGSTMSLLSLSTYAGDDKEVWQEFRRELVALGFRSKSLDRHKDLLQAYMLKLDQSGLLDEVKDPSDQSIAQPWWKKHDFLETVNSLPGLQPIDEEEPALQLHESSSRPSNYSINDGIKDIQQSRLAQTKGLPPYHPEILGEAEPPFRKEVDASVSKENTLVTSSGTTLVELPWPTDSEESEKETTGGKKARRSRAKKKPEYKASDTDTGDESSVASRLRRGRRVRTKKPEDKAKTGDRVGDAADVVTETAPEAIGSLTKDEDEHENNSNIDTLLSKPATPQLHAADMRIDARSGPPNSRPSIPDPQPAIAVAVAALNDTYKKPLHNSKSDKSLQAETPFIALLPQEPVRIGETRGSTEVLQPLDQHPGNLALEADVPKIRQPESRNAEGVEKPAQDSKSTEYRSEKAATNLKGRNSGDKFVHDSMKTLETDYRASRTREIPGKNPSMIRNQSPKSYRQTHASKTTL